MKLFASETIDVIDKLAMYNNTVVKPSGRMPEHAACLDELVTMLHLLRLGDKTAQPNYIDQLDLSTRVHHGLFICLYHATVKCVHFPFHIVQQIRDLLKNCSCFAPERNHKAGKSHASHCVNGNFEGTVLVRAFHDFVIKCMEPLQYEPEHLVGARSDPGIVGAAIHGCIPAASYKVASQCKTKTGTYKRNFFVFLDFGPKVELARVKFFFSADERAFAMVELFDRVGENTWSLNQPSVAVTQIALLFSCPPTRVTPGTHLISALLPRFRL